MDFFDLTPLNNAEGVDPELLDIFHMASGYQQDGLNVPNPMMTVPQNDSITSIQPRRTVGSLRSIQSDPNMSARLPSSMSPMSLLVNGPLTNMSLNDDPFDLGNLPTTQTLQNIPADSAIMQQTSSSIELSTPLGSLQPGPHGTPPVATDFSPHIASPPELFPAFDLLEQQMRQQQWQQQQELMQQQEQQHQVRQQQYTLQNNSPSALNPSPFRTPSPNSAASALRAGSNNNMFSGMQIQPIPPFRGGNRNMSASSAMQVDGQSFQGPLTGPAFQSSRQRTNNNTSDKSKSDNKSGKGRGRGGGGGSGAGKGKTGSNDKDREKLKSRLARKAELARASRRRKKAYVQDLEKKVKNLAERMEQLQKRATKERARREPMSMNSEEKVRNELQDSIRKELRDIAHRDDINKTEEERIASLVRQFAGNSRDRMSTVDFYLDRVEDCILPPLQSKFILWGLDQSDDFYSKPGELWMSLMSKELGLTDEQMQFVLSKRAAIQQEKKALLEGQKMIQKTRVAIDKHLRTLNQTMDQVQNIMTPLQLAKFYSWVDENEWCMQMLNSAPG